LKGLASEPTLLHNPLTSVNFPVYLRFGGVSIPPHPLFESLAYVIAFRVYLSLRKRTGDMISSDMRWWVIAAATVGAAFGSKLLGTLENYPNAWRDLGNGKTIVGGLVGGWIAVESIKRHFDVSVATGDLFAIPLAVGIVIGRIGCFLTGLADQTYGTATSRPWGINFGDGVTRHPTQLYEIAFLTLLAAFLWRMMRAPHSNGDVFKAFLILYLSWRFIIDFLKPDATFWKLSAIQWTCLAALVVYHAHLGRVLKTFLGWRAGEELNNSRAPVVATDL
jgi:phosphatidylglycerol:prolipoprotein diacylglycerol transferase